MKFQVIGKNIKLTDAIKGHLDNKINKIFFIVNKFHFVYYLFIKHLRLFLYICFVLLLVNMYQYYANIMQISYTL